MTTQEKSRIKSGKKISIKTLRKVHVTVKTTTYRERTNLKRKTTAETVIGENQITSINLSKIPSTIGIKEKQTKTNNEVILFCGEASFTNIA